MLVSRSKQPCNRRPVARLRVAFDSWAFYITVIFRAHTSKLISRRALYQTRRQLAHEAAVVVDVLHKMQR